MPYIYLIIEFLDYKSVLSIAENTTNVKFIAITIRFIVLFEFNYLYTLSNYKFKY